MKYLKLSQGKRALIDDEDYERVANIKWYLHMAGYGATKHFGDTTLLHRFILNAPKGTTVDHKNGNKLDNRRSNIRLCTHAQNLWNTGKSISNTSGYKGVQWFKPAKLWRARVTANGKEICKYFETKEEAIKYCPILRAKLHGEFARLK